MITPRAYLVSGMGFCFYLILLFNTNLPNQFYVLTWLSVGVLVSSLGVAVLAIFGLDYEGRVTRARVTEEWESGENTLHGGPTLELTIGNHGSFNKTDLLFEVRLGCPRRNESLTRTFLIEALPAGQSLTCELPFSDLPRGRYHIEGAALQIGDVLGLFRMRRKLQIAGADDELIVGPAIVTLGRNENGASGGLLNGAARTAGGQGTGDEFRGTRFYVPGDDLRTVHWKSTARQGQLVVKEFHHHEQTQRMIIWDGAVGSDRGEGAASSTECALRLTASLCHALSEQRRGCGFLRLDSQAIYLPAPAGRGADNLGQITELLADADALRVTPLSAALGGFVRHLNAAGEVYLVTQSLSSEVMRAALLLRGYGAQVFVALVEANVFGEGNALSPHEAPESYAAVAQSLRRNAIKCVLVPGDVHDSESNPLQGAAQALTLGRALRELLAPAARRGSVAASDALTSAK
jgi:uncharacterized protein (DUF58 family)